MKINKPENDKYEKVSAAVPSVEEKTTPTQNSKYDVNKRGTVKNNSQKGLGWGSIWEFEYFNDDRDIKVREYYDKGNAAINKGDYDLAIDYFQKSIDLDPKNTGSYCSLGCIYYLKGGYDTAIRYLQISIDLNPKLIEAYYMMGLSYAAKGFYIQAANYIMKSAQLGYHEAQKYCKNNNISWQMY